MGFPAIIIFAWIFDIGPAGIERTQPSAAGTTSRVRYLALTAVVVLASLGAYVGWQRYGNRAGSDTLDSFAVLPFANMSGDPAQEPFSDGISEEILNALAQVDGLSVAARTSAFAFKNVTADVRDIARKLGVAAVLEGSVRISKALRALDDLAARKWIHSRRMLPWLYLRLDGREGALDYLERMYSDHDANMFFMFYDLRLAELRSEPRFRTLAQKMGITPPSPI